MQPSVMFLRLDDVAFVRCSQTGHLVHVEVTMLDITGKVVENLGLLDPWVCIASLTLGSTQSQRYTATVTSSHILQ